MVWVGSPNPCIRNWVAWLKSTTVPDSVLAEHAVKLTVPKLAKGTKLPDGSPLGRASMGSSTIQSAL